MDANYRFSEYNVFRKDNDGHKYVIPKEYVDEFDALLEAVCSAKMGSSEFYDLNDEIDSKFGKFKVC